MHNFVAVCELKLELQSGSPQFGPKWSVFDPGDIEIWRMTLKNNRAHLLCYTSSYVHHFIAIREFKLELRSGNVQFGSKAAIFCPVWPWNLADDLEKPLMHIFSDTLSFVHNYIAIGEFKLELQSRNSQIGAKFVLTFVTLSFDLWHWPFAWTSLLSMVITHQKFDDDTMRRTLWKRCHMWTDRRTDEQKCP